ncbi:MAG: pyridoxamine 5'-phosphate oxidase family protein [Chloroflexia bacterium]
MTEQNLRTRHAKPTASRPDMPGYGILDAGSGSGLLSWDWATTRLAQARTYWISTTRPDGRPHAMPVWGVWLNDTFYFSSGPDSRKARNLAANPRCVVGTEPAGDAIIVEGESEPVTDPLVRRQFAEVYSAKYEWPMDDFAEPIYAVRPTVVFAFPTGDFVSGATRWVFE